MSVGAAFYSIHGGFCLTRSNRGAARSCRRMVYKALVLASLSLQLSVPLTFTSFLDN